jgi:hypothetical protein
MHDNAVTCLNPTATRLLGIANSKNHTVGDADGAPSKPAGELDDAFSIVLGIPGDSIRSARIERAVSAWGAGEGEAQPQQDEPGVSPTVEQGAPRGSARDSTPSAKPASGGTGGESTGANHSAADERDTQDQLGTGIPDLYAGADGRVGAGASASADASALNLLPLDASPHAAASDGSAASDTGIDADTAKSHNEDSAASATSAEEHGAAYGNGTNDADAQSGRKASKESKSDAAKPSRRKSRRSAVPSWDEILFGD